jgi:hypothetical protein
VHSVSKIAWCRSRKDVCVLDCPFSVGDLGWSDEVGRQVGLLWKPGQGTLAGMAVRIVVVHLGTEGAEPSFRGKLSTTARRIGVDIDGRKRQRSSGFGNSVRECTAAEDTSVG